MANEFDDDGNIKRQRIEKPRHVTEKIVEKFHSIDAFFLSLHLHYHNITLYCII